MLHDYWENVPGPGNGKYKAGVSSGETKRTIWGWSMRAGSQAGRWDGFQRWAGTSSFETALRILLNMK